MRRPQDLTFAVSRPPLSNAQGRPRRDPSHHPPRPTSSPKKQQGDGAKSLVAQDRNGRTEPSCNRPAVAPSQYKRVVQQPDRALNVHFLLLPTNKKRLHPARRFQKPSRRPKAQH